MIRGRALKYGDNIDTDVIIPAKYATSLDPDFLGSHCLEGIDPDFIKRRRPGDLIVAGRNFGCGSSREIAPISIKGAGISCVIAKSFARIFFRNAINIGLPILESPEAVEDIEEGDEVEVDLNKGLIRNLTRGKTFQSAPFPEVVQEIISAGGLVNFVRKRLGK